MTLQIFGPTKSSCKGRASRELILDATDRLYGHTAIRRHNSIIDIRRAAGCRPSSIYWHFGSRKVCWRR